MAVGVMLFVLRCLGLGPRRMHSESAPVFEPIRGPQVPNLKRLLLKPQLPKVQRVPGSQERRFK